MSRSEWWFSVVFWALVTALIDGAVIWGAIAAGLLHHVDPVVAVGVGSGVGYVNGRIAERRNS